MLCAAISRPFSSAVEYEVPAYGTYQGSHLRPLLRSSLHCSSCSFGWADWLIEEGLVVPPAACGLGGIIRVLDCIPSGSPSACTTAAAARPHGSCASPLAKPGLTLYTHYYTHSIHTLTHTVYRHTQYVHTHIIDTHCRDTQYVHTL